jgi:hypothetical protein
MEVSALTLRVLLLFFPGVLCAMLVDALTVHRERTATQFLTHSFVLGLTSYLLLYTVQGVCAEVSGVLGLPPPLPVTFIDALLNDKLRIAWGEIVLAGVFAVGLGAALSAGINHKILYRVGRRLHITRRRGSPDLWSYVLDSQQTAWITARDLEHGFAYYGLMQAYSETVDLAELWLRDVVVYASATGTKLYEANALYLSQDPRSITIEVLPTERHTGADDGRKGLRTVDAEQVQPQRKQHRSGPAPAGLHSGSAGASAGTTRKPRKRR